MHVPVGIGNEVGCDGGGRAGIYEQDDVLYIVGSEDIELEGQKRNTTWPDDWAMLKNTSSNATVIPG